MPHELPDYYAILGVASTAAPAEIAHAYRARIRSHHPDSHPDTVHDTAADGLAAVITAYTVLRDPARRADYDQQRQSTTTNTTAPPPTTPVASPSRPQPLLRVGPARYHGPPHRGHQ